MIGVLSRQLFPAVLGSLVLVTAGVLPNARRRPAAANRTQVVLLGTEPLPPTPIDRDRRRRSS